MASQPSLRPAFHSLLRSTSSRNTSSYICRPCLVQQQRQQQRNLHRSVTGLPTPPPTPFVPDVSTFLKLIGRGLSAHASKFESWEKMFALSSPELKALGIEPPEKRRYLLRWLQKFRRGEFGIGGDLQHISEDGVAELRVVELPSLPRKSGTGEPLQRDVVSISQTPGMTKLVLNVPNGSATYKLEAGQTTADLKKPRDFRLRNGHSIAGPYVQPMKGTHGLGATFKIEEGLWENKKGVKVHGGERRRAMVLHKLAVAEHRKNA